MKIRTKIFLIFVSVSFVFTAIGMISLLMFADNSLRQSISLQLKIANDSKSSYIRYFIEQQVNSNIILSKDHHLSDLLIQNYENISPEGFFSKEDFYFHTESVLNDILRKEMVEIFILDSKGDVILSTKKDWVGENRRSADYFLNSKKETFIGDVYYEEENNKFVYTISSPIFNKNRDKYLGSIVSLINMENLFATMSDSFDLGNTSESYLVNKNKYMVTPSRFVENSILTQKIDNQNITNCFSDDIKKESIDLEPESYINYYNKNVLGFYSYIPIVDWCLVSEIGEDEIFYPLNTLFIVFLVIGIILLILISLSSNWIGASIGGPIEKLRKNIKVIERGNLDYDVRLNIGGEIGQLSEAFNKMIESVKNSKKEISRRVEEQTKEIISKKESIEKQQLAILNILEDVEGERIKTAFEKEKISTLLSSIGEGVFAVDVNLNIIAFNEAAEKISGFSSKEVLGKKYNTFLHFISELDNSPVGGFVEEVIKLEKMVNLSDNSLLIKKNGEKVPVADSAAPIKDNNGLTIGCIVVFRDVSKSRKIDQMKSEFVSIASHQLRTPLTGIQWVSERLLKISDQLPEKEQGYINDIYISAKRLSRLVDDLLNVSRIEGGRVAITPEKIDAVKFLNNYFEEIKPLAIQKNINLNLEKGNDSIEMMTDRSALQNIYQSLISNAIEYTPAGGKVTVNIKRIDRSVLFEVSDTGIGIPKDDQETIFEKFTRGSNAQSVKTDGTGFGLYIAKQTVDLLGGKIRFESEENKGTVFFVELPIESKSIKGDKKLT